MVTLIVCVNEVYNIAQEIRDKLTQLLCGSKFGNKIMSQRHVIHVMSMLTTFMRTFLLYCRISGDKRSLALDYMSVYCTVGYLETSGR